MTDCQKILFDWVAAQPGLTGAAVFGAGLLFGICGLRMIRFLVVLSLGGYACLAGLALAALINQPLILVVPGLGALGGVLGLAWPRGALVVSSAVTFGGLGGYLAVQLGLHETAVWVAFGVCGALGAVLALVSRQTMIMLSTVLQGSALMILGFVGIASAAWPTVGSTFRSCANQNSLVVPILMAMLAATAYSFQSMQRQGDIRTGSQTSPRL